MKFFPADLWERWQSGDAAADAEWEDALSAYERHLADLSKRLPAHVADYLGLLLHDAAIDSLATGQGRLVMVLRTDAPHSGLVVISYELTAQPEIVAYAKRPRPWGRPMRFDFDEFDLATGDGTAVYSQAIVLDGGWELRLKFRDVQITRAQPLTPQVAQLVPMPGGPLPQTA